MANVLGVEFEIKINSSYFKVKYTTIKTTINILIMVIFFGPDNIIKEGIANIGYNFNVKAKNKTIIEPVVVIVNNCPASTVIPNMIKSILPLSIPSSAEGEKAAIKNITFSIEFLK